MRGTPNYVGHIPEFMCAPLVQNLSNQFVGLFRLHCTNLEKQRNGAGGVSISVWITFANMSDF